MEKFAALVVLLVVLVLAFSLSATTDIVNTESPMFVPVIALAIVGFATARYLMKK